MKFLILDIIHFQFVWQKHNNIVLALIPQRSVRPVNHDILIREIRLSAGAEFIVAIAGDIMTMPGLPRNPAAYEVCIGKDGNIKGLF